MTSFVAIYRGKSIADARLIAVSADPTLVARISENLLDNKASFADPVVQTLEGGRRAALRLVVDEARKAEGEDEDRIS